MTGKCQMINRLTRVDANIMDIKGLFLVSIFIVANLMICICGSASIQVPSAGNCGEDTVLTCQVTGAVREYTSWYGLNKDIFVEGNKYTETKGSSSFTLTIHNTNISDEGDYRCENGFDQSDLKRLNIECKASSATHSVTRGKKIQITIDKLYPASPNFTTTFERQENAIQISGSKTCSRSAQYSGYYRCDWSSSNSLDNGYYTYSVVVTTISQANPLTGSFKIVSPESPLISNIVQLNASREVLYGNEGQSLTINCSSKGGYPVPTVTWYKDSIPNPIQLDSTSSGILQSDLTYMVNLQYTFTPVASDDRKNLICTSYYPKADSAHVGSNSKSVLLYLTLKPNQPTVIQTSVVSAGNDVTVRCRTSGSRPAASISWLYQGVKYNGSTTSTLDATSETFTVISTYTRQVIAADNGQSIQCRVTHPTLVSPNELTKSINFNVYFSVGPSTTIITGNKEIIATGSTQLILTCTTGSSNPASNITWKNGSDILVSDRSVTNSSGDNNGVVRSQQLTLYPTRYMDGDVITCSVSNTVSQSPVVDKVKLTLKYFPVVSIQGEQQYTLTEGENKEFTCKVESRPISTIKWYHENNLISQGTPASNVFSLSLSPVNRTNYGSYSCKANNGIESEQQDQISINVRFKPLTTTITGNSNIIANGRTKSTLNCTSGSSNPISDITWKINNVKTTATQNLSEENGEYGGSKRRQRLILTPTRDNDGDVISCEAKNTLGTSNKHEEPLDLRYRPLITPMSDVTVVEGNHSVLLCVATSKPASTFKWYRQGQSSNVLHQGTGTLDNNKLSYRIDNVRRSDAATYICNANNGVENADNKSVLLTVNYPPDVTVTTTNTTVNAASLIIMCNANGVPNNKYRYGKWVHRWPGHSIPITEKNGSETLELTDLTYQHSGIYTCSASNGIKVFNTNKEFMEGSVQLIVKSFPIITNLTEKTSARLMENATIYVYYFSNAGAADVKVYRNVNGSRQDEVKYSVIETNVQVDLNVFTQTIKTGGVKAQILAEIQTKEDMGIYYVSVLNEVNSTVRPVEIVAKGPPSLPSNIIVDNINYNEVRLSWRRGYHGGFPQTFVIQFSTDQRSWRNVKVFDGKNENEEMISEVLTGLSPSTTYFVRMYSFNQEGNSTVTESLNYTTSAKIDTSGPNMSALIGGAAGGTSAVLIIVVVIFLVRRGTFTKCKPKEQDRKSDRKPVYEDEDDYGMRDNPMYVSAGPRDAAGGSGQSNVEVEYSTVDKKKNPVIGNQTDVYAEVDKSKKRKNNNGKKDKKNKKGLVKDNKGKKAVQDNDLYENTTELMDTKQSKNEETIYENPELSKQPAKKNFNKDGLIYADLTFNDQPKGQKKLVIHGLDSMTEYVEVDFTKKADPLPDSDDENVSPK